MPIAVREFSRTDRLLVRVPTFGPGGTTPALSVHLLNRGGQAMSEIPATPAPEGRRAADRRAAERPRARRVRRRDQGHRRAGDAKELVGFASLAEPHAALASRRRSPRSRRRAPRLVGVPIRVASTRRAAGPISPRRSRPAGRSHRRHRRRRAAAGRLEQPQADRLRGARRRRRPGTRERALRQADGRTRGVCSRFSSTSTTSSAGSTARVREALATFIDQALRPRGLSRRDEAARLAVRDSPDARSRGGAGDRPAASKGAAATTRRGTPTSATSWPARRRGSTARAAQVALSAINALAVHLGSVPDRRKTLDRRQ